MFVGLVRLEATASFSPGSRSILRDIGNAIADDQKDNAIELNATNFDSVFRDTPAKYAVLEFFAHWSVLLIFCLNKVSIFIFIFIGFYFLLKELNFNIRMYELWKGLFCAVTDIDHCSVCG